MGPAVAEQPARLPEVPACMEHMNFEHDRIGVVSYGWEEMRIWMTHARRLEQCLARRSSEAARLRPVASVMASNLYGLPSLVDEHLAGVAPAGTEATEAVAPPSSNSAL